MKQFDNYLEKTLKKQTPSKVLEAMTYSLLGGGKRVRVKLLFNLLTDYGYEIDELAMTLAAAVESIHTYSLIHDDLPALDNDDLRRFKPTNHKVFGEDIAILAGDGLLTFAFDLVSSTNLEMKYIKALSDNAGVNGMILGQEIDILNRVETLEDLEKAYALKTGRLFSASFELATYLAKKDPHLETVKKLASLLGIAFQVQDDLLEVTKDTQEIGKSNESDMIREIHTITSFMTLDAAQTYLEETFDEIYALIETLNLEGDSLLRFINELRRRSI